MLSAWWDDDSWLDGRMVELVVVVVVAADTLFIAALTLFFFFSQTAMTQLTIPGSPSSRIRTRLVDYPRKKKNKRLLTKLVMCRLLKRQKETQTHRNQQAEPTKILYKCALLPYSGVLACL